MDVRLRIATTTGRDWEGSVVVFVPDRLRHREAESTAWWWSERGQNADPESVTSVGVGGAVVRVRATDSELTASEARCASLLGTHVLDARTARIYVGSFGELPQCGTNLRRPDRQFLPLAPGRYLVELHKIMPPRRQRSVHSSALAISGRELLIGGAKPARWSVPELKAVEGFSLDAGSKILGVSDRALLLFSGARELVCADANTGTAGRGTKLGAHDEAPSGALPWGGTTWALDKGQYLVLHDSDAKREVRRLNLESPIVALDKLDDDVVTLTKDGRLSVVSMESREIRKRWSSGCVLPSGLRVRSGHAIVAGLDGDVRAIDLASGATIWATELPVGAPRCIACGEEGSALVGGAEGGLCLVKEADGTVLAAVAAPPIVGLHQLVPETWVAVTPDELLVLDSSLDVTRRKAVIRRKKEAIDPELLPDLVLVFRSASS